MAKVWRTCYQLKSIRNSLAIVQRRDVIKPLTRTSISHSFKFSLKTCHKSIQLPPAHKKTKYSTVMINKASTHLLSPHFSNSKGHLNYYQCNDFKIRINHLHGYQNTSYCFEWNYRVIQQILNFQHTNFVNSLECNPEPKCFPEQVCIKHRFKDKDAITLRYYLTNK